MSDELNPAVTEHEKIIRTTGAWCDNGKVKGATHFYVARNPASKTAISLCQTVLIDLGHLAIITPVRRCLVCDLYAGGEREVLNRIKQHAENTIIETDSK